MLTNSYTDTIIAQLRAIWEHSRVVHYNPYERYYGGDHPQQGVLEGYGVAPYQAGP